MPMPALLTSTSMPPNCAWISSLPESTDAPSRTSISIPTAAGPSAAAAACARDRTRLVTATRAPARTNASAIALPSPLVAPVTTTRVPLSAIKRRA